MSGMNTMKCQVVKRCAVNCLRSGNLEDTNVIRQ